MTKRGDFWIGILILTLLLSMILWGDLTIDINLHDTYIVTHYSHFLYPIITWFGIAVLLYFFLNRRYRTINGWVQIIHILTSYSTTLIYIYLVWGTTIALTGMNNRYYNYTSGEPDVSLFIINFIVFIISQIVFVGAILKSFTQRS